MNWSLCIECIEWYDMNKPCGFWLTDNIEPTTFYSISVDPTRRKIALVKVFLLMTNELTLGLETLLVSGLPHNVWKGPAYIRHKRLVSYWRKNLHMATERTPANLQPFNGTSNLPLSYQYFYYWHWKFPKSIASKLFDIQLLIHILYLDMLHFYGTRGGTKSMRQK